MAIAVKLDDLLHDRRMTLTELADRVGHDAGQPLDPQDRQGARDPLLDARCDLRARSRASPATFSGSRPSKQNASHRQSRTNGAQADETSSHTDHHVSALDPPLLIALGGRSRPRDRAGNRLCLRGPAHPGRLALRNAGARRAAVGAGHHPSRGDPCVWRPCPPHAGERDLSAAGSPPTPAAPLFWVWTLIALGASGMLSVVLSARALWSLRRGRRDLQVSMLLPIHVAAGGLALVLGAVALSGEEGRDHPPPQRAAVRLRHARHGRHRLDPGVLKSRDECGRRLDDGLLCRHGADDRPPRVAMDPRYQRCGADGRGRARALRIVAGVKAFNIPGRSSTVSRSSCTSSSPPS